MSLFLIAALPFLGAVFPALLIRAGRNACSWANPHHGRRQRARQPKLRPSNEHLNRLLRSAAVGRRLCVAAELRAAIPRRQRGRV